MFSLDLQTGTVVLPNKCKQFMVDVSNELNSEQQGLPLFVALKWENI